MPRRYGPIVPSSERARAVAERAVDVAAAAGVELPDGLELWHLAGGRPRAGQAPVPGTADELGRVLEASFDDRTRRTLGAHYTPASIADELVARALDGLRGHAHVERACDPACGGGAFLLAMARALEARGLPRPDIVRNHMFGADVDPLALATAEVALTVWSGGTAPAPGHLVAGDALVERLGLWPDAGAGFDLVAGNPPFLNQLERGTTRSLAGSAQLREIYGDAVRAYTDTAWLFLLAACAMSSAAGRVVLVQPVSLLGARDAARVRAAVARTATLREIWLPSARAFAANVDVCAPVLEMGASPRASDTEWARVLASARGVPATELDATRTLGEIVSATAGFRDEYYGLVPAVREARRAGPIANDSAAPLVTARMIDVGRCTWGARPVRFAKRDWMAPVVDVAALREAGLPSDKVATAAQRWVDRTRLPKVVVANQTRVLEAAVDVDGDWVPSVPLIAVLAPRDRLWHVAAAICSPPVNAWVLHHTAGTALALDAIKLPAKLVGAVPAPIDDRAWDEGAALLQRISKGDDVHREFGAVMCAAYGLTCDVTVLEWWLERL